MTLASHQKRNGNLSSTPVISRVAQKWLDKIDTEKIDYRPNVPPWATPLLRKSRYKGTHGGRSGGKSHFFAERLLARMVDDPGLRSVCIREIQKSLKFSAKALIENKIREFGLSPYFEVLTTEIRRRGGNGLIIFQGMQDHTADSIKSLEGFGIAWVEEAQNLSGRSLSLLRPTIRAPGSEIWFSWNPEQPDDAVDAFFRGSGGPPKDAIVVEVNYRDNPKLPAEAIAEMEIDRARDPDYYHHVWMGGYNIKSDLQVLGGKWRVDEFTPGDDWDGPYYGGDWGFAQDPVAAVELWIYDKKLWVNRESWAIELDLDDIAARWRKDIPGIENYIVRVDNSRPDTINHVRNRGKYGERLAIPKIVGAEKWAGSIEEGVAYLRNFDEIVVHERCHHYQEECRLYRHKTNAAGDILPGIVDKHNHCLSPDTLVETIDGPKRIDSIKSGELVLTRKGYRRVIDAWVSDRNAKTYKVTTSNGLVLIGTGNHKVFTDRGFVPIDELRYDDSVTTLGNRSCQELNRSNTEGLYLHATRMQNEGQSGFIINQWLRNLQVESIDSIDVSGRIATGRFLKGGMFTILTKTLVITTFLIWNAFQEVFICQSTRKPIMQPIEKQFCDGLSQFVPLLSNGTVKPKKAERFTKDLLITSAWKIAQSLRKIVIIVGNLTKLTISAQAGLGFAPISASQHGEERQESIMSIASAPSAIEFLRSTNTATLNAVVTNVLSVSEHNILPEVWDLMVEDEHEFFANGILVHNCIDSTRYALTPLIRAKGNVAEMLRAMTR